MLALWPPSWARLTVARDRARSADDPLLANYHAAALAPLGPADQYELLVPRRARRRGSPLSTMLADAEEALRVPRWRAAARRSGFDGGGEADGVRVDDEQP